MLLLTDDAKMMLVEEKEGKKRVETEEHARQPSLEWESGLATTVASPA